MCSSNETAFLWRAYAVWSDTKQGDRTSTTGGTHVSLTFMYEMFAIENNTWFSFIQNNYI